MRTTERSIRARRFSRLCTTETSGSGCFEWRCQSSMYHTTVHIRQNLYIAALFRWLRCTRPFVGFLDSLSVRNRTDGRRFDASETGSVLLLKSI